jgi:16S rRNA (uracil1498-N3)-methyltransferase
MRLHRFFVHTPITNETFDLADKDLVHQWKHVFRYNVGSQVVLFDGSGVDYYCMITSLRNLGATVQVMRKVENNPGSRKNVWLCMAMIKKDNFEWVAQKATELGVTHIVPLLCEHSEKRKLNMDRMRTIAIEASEQSGRGDIPVIHDPVKIGDVLQSGMLPQEKVLFHPDGIPFDQYKHGTLASSVALFVGPEGGFSDKEIALCKIYNMPVVTLGKQILRAETAGITVSALLLFS